MLVGTARSGWLHTDRRVYVQQQETEATVGEADANREKDTKVAEAVAEAAKGTKHANAVLAMKEAERIRREARGEADAVLLKYEAEAKGIRQALDSKAAGYESLVRSCDGDAKSAATLLMIEKIEEIVSMQVEAIKNLKIDKITVWDSGGASGDGSTTANFLSSLIKSLPPIHDVAEMAGVELPQYLGTVSGAGEMDAKPPVPEQS